MIYTTIQGDMWDAIAFKVYGRESAMTVLLRANPAHHKTAVFLAGVKLQCPNITRGNLAFLPPWRR